MTKLIIQIPCYNEADTLPLTVRDLPRSIEDVDTIEVLVIDDGSTDGTADVARELDVDHVIRLTKNKGLAVAFARGLEASLELGADIIVNTDGDNQYRGECIRDLVQPILKGEAEMVVGDRQIKTIQHFSAFKKVLQKLGSWIVRWASKTNVPDATSGFRAFSKEAALRLSVYSEYTYTLETIIQAGKKGISITSVPVETNEVLRESRLIHSTFQYVIRSAITITRIFLMYEALRVFLTLSVIPLLGGLFLLGRFTYYFLIGDGQGHIQSMIVATILIVLGFLTILIGLLSDLIARNRTLGEDANYRLKKMDIR
ncbi:MAG: glycosyltransferase family 2 protein [Anaerolineales bacterium]